MNEMIKRFQQRKLILKAALSNVDAKPNNKIIFNENEITSLNTDESTLQVTEKEKPEKTTLFDSDEESEDNINFEVKEQFEGNRGKKLFELQSRYKNDKRFILDERFVDDENVNNDGVSYSEITEPTIEEEKKKQFEILEQVLGNKVKSKIHGSEKERDSKKGMLRFDPMQSDHLKYELKNAEKPNKNKRKAEFPKRDVISKENGDEVEQPKVSKEIFYKVSDNFKETFQKEKSFSLLSSFGNPEQLGNLEEEVEQPKEIKKNIKLYTDNPFKYDSSDDEESENIKNNEEPISTKDNDQNPENKLATFWCEPFFFRDDDYRLQEGLDFMKRIASEQNNEFVQLRKDIKSIVKAKVRNNQRKNKPFKKKLGGNKRKKMIRIKKALKR